MVRCEFGEVFYPAAEAAGPLGVVKLKAGADDEDGGFASKALAH